MNHKFAFNLLRKKNIFVYKHTESAHMHVYISSIDEYIYVCIFLCVYDLNVISTTFCFSCIIWNTVLKTVSLGTGQNGTKFYVLCVPQDCLLSSHKNKTRGLRSWPPEMTNWKRYKWLRDRLKDIQEIQSILEIVQKYPGNFSKYFINIYHPELDIFLFWHDFSKEVNLLTDWQT